MIPWTGKIKRYLIANVNVGSSNTTYTIKGPLNKKGRLWDYGVQSVTTTFAGATSTPHMKVGFSGTLAAYGVEYDFGTLSTTSGSKSPRIDLNTDAATWRSAAFVDADIPANQVVYATMVAATGGGAAGVADFYMEIIWQD